MAFLNIKKRNRSFDGNIMDHIKSYEDACEHQSRNPIEELPYKEPKNKEEEALNAVKMLWIIAKSLQGNFKADFGDSKQKKWRPWFVWDANKSAFVFSDTGYAYDYANANVGVRLVFETEKIAAYFGTQFIDLHNKVLKNN